CGLVRTQDRQRDRMVSPRYEGDDTGREDRREGRLDSRERVLRVARDRVDVARIDRVEDSERVYAGEHVVRSHETGRVPNGGGTFPGPAPVRRRIVPGNAQEHATSYRSGAREGPSS